MKRTKLNDRKMPQYTKGEEIFNMTSHIVGGGFAVIALVLTLIFSIIHNNGYAIVSSIVYGISMIVLYTMSSIYHGLSPRLKAKRVFQVLDHCSIFVLIAGSYTPFCLVTFRQDDPYFGWILFACIWGVAILGIVLNSIDLRRYRVISMIGYLGMGWCIIFSMKKVIELIGNIRLYITTIRWSSLLNRCNTLWCRKKSKIYAFCISFVYSSRKYITIFMHNFICNINSERI